MPLRLECALNKIRIVVTMGTGLMATAIAAIKTSPNPFATRWLL
jgi:hypothetical protein